MGTMNYWKKMAFILALVAGVSGGAWAQSEYRDKDKPPGYGETSNDYPSGYANGLTIGRNDRSTHRDYQPGNCKAYKDGNEAYRKGFLAGYDEGFGRSEEISNWGRQGLEREHRDWDRGGYPDPTYQSGYNEGLRMGRSDRSANRAYQPGNCKAYEDGNEVYRKGFVAGYDEGFGRGESK